MKGNTGPGNWLRRYGWELLRDPEWSAMSLRRQAKASAAELDALTAENKELKAKCERLDRDLLSLSGICDWQEGRIERLEVALEASEAAKGG